MKEQTEEQKDHFSADRNHWCVVEYQGATPWYYAGYFGRSGGGKDEFGMPIVSSIKPAFTIDFNEALKLHSKIAAENILNNLKKHASSSLTNSCKVEDHRWM